MSGNRKPILKPLLKRNPRRSKCIAIFALFLLSWVIIVYEVLPLLATMTDSNQTIMLGIFLGALVVLIVVSVIACCEVLASEEIVGAPVPFDTSKIARVVRERNMDEVVEHVVYGTSDSTYREACEDGWPFETIDRNDDWIIQDSQSNDITNRPLIECSGIATIVVYSGSPASSEEADHLPEWWDAED